MPKIGHLCSKFWKAIIRLETITLKRGYMRNFVKIRKLILSGTKCPKLGIWAHNFEKQIPDLKSTPSK